YVAPRVVYTGRRERVGKSTKPLGDDERRHIQDLIRSGKARNEIAREVGRSPGTVSNIASAAGLSFDRTATRAATRAKQDDNRSRRSELEGLLIEDAHRLRKQLWLPARVFDFTKDGEYVEHEHPEPTFGDKRAISQSLNALVKSSAELAKLNETGDDGGADVDRWLSDMVPGP
ncbi:MAG: helix-turn-helix domain-containing protein, partial [Nitriliruptoraceae bacterium]